MQTPYEYVIIVGYGRLGALLAGQLSRLGCSVVVIDHQEKAFDKTVPGFSGFKITGNATELNVLKQAKIDKADCLLAVTNQDNVNLMVAQVAKTVFQVAKVVVRVYDPRREATYNQFGIETISPTRLSTNAFLAALQSTSKEKAE